LAIVLVDDDKTILDGLRGQVEKLYSDLRCETAEDADEAWEVLDELAGEQVRVVVLVSDWLMPGTKGDELLRQVRARYPGIGCVMLTGQAPRDAEAGLLDDGIVSRVLHKPWTEPQLREAIDRAAK
jgi:CheY-like chemotaxis protein